MPRPVVTVELDVDGSGAFATDISGYVDLKKGIAITRGRGDEFADVEPSTCSMTLDNTDGTFSYGSSAVTNLLTNGSFEAPLQTGLVDGWWDVTSPDYTVARTTIQHRMGAYSLMMTSTTGTLGQLGMLSGTIPVSAGQAYTLSGWVKAGTTARAIVSYIEWSTGATSFGTHPAMAEAGTSWTFFSVTAVAPPGTTYCSVRLLVDSQPLAMPIGEKHYLDGLMLETGTVAHPYFEGPAPFTVALDMPIRVSVTTGATTSKRFTGYVTRWPVGWPGGQRSSVATITASDRLAKLTRRRLRSVVEQTVLEVPPAEYFVLGEDETATSVGDTSGNGEPALGVTQRGAGGTLELGAGTGPPTDGHTAPVFARASATDGKYLSGPGSLAWFTNFSLRLIVNTSLVAAQTFLRVADPAYSPRWLEVGCTAAGHLTVANPFFTLTHAVSIATGATVDIVVTGQQVLADSSTDVKVYRNGALVASGNFYPVIVDAEAICIGGGPASPLASATISHIAIWESVLTAAQVARLNTSRLDGFTADSSDARVARIAGWAGIAAVDMTLEAGNLVDTAHFDTDGLSPVEAMQRVAATEQGLVFIDGAGELVFHARTHRYGPATDVTLTAPDLGVDSEFVLDTQGLVNLVTAQRPGGATQTVRNAASIARYDEYPEDLTLLVLTDAEALQAAAWRATVHAEPSARLGSLPVDLLTQSTALATATQALSLSDVIALSGLPVQAPLSAARLFVEGWTEQIGYDDWSMVFNTSPLTGAVWKLEDPIYGQLDALNRLAY